MTAGEYNTIQQLKEYTRPLLDTITTRSQNGKGYICPVKQCGQHKGNTLHIGSTNYITCFACGTAGSIVDFYAKAKGISLQQAILDCCKLTGVTPPEQSKSGALELNEKINTIQQAQTLPATQTEAKTQPATVQRKLQAVQPATYDFEQQGIEYNKYIQGGARRSQDTQTQQAMQYLTDRGINYTFAKAHNAEACNATTLLSYGFSLSESEKNIILKSGAVVFTCYKGKACRVTSHAEKIHKKSKNTDGNNNYLFLVDGEIRPATRVVITEAALDALQIGQTAEFFGVDNVTAVAPIGVSTKEIKEYLATHKQQCNACKFLVAFDNDNTGQQAGAKLVKELTEAGYNAAQLPTDYYYTYKDFNELQQGSPEQWLIAFSQIVKLFNQLKDKYEAAALSTDLQTVLTDFTTIKLDFVSTPFAKLNELLGGGFRQNYMYILGGGTGIGKTALLTQIALTAAGNGNPVLYYSLEINKQDFTARALSQLTAVVSNHNGNSFCNALTQFAVQNQATKPLTGEQANTYNAAVNYFTKIAQRFYLINDYDSFSVAKLIDFVGGYCKQKQPEAMPLLIVDYLQLLKCGNPAIEKDARQNINECITMLNNLTVNNKLTTIAVSSLNRASNDGATIQSFKESGNIEYTAAGALLLSVDRVEKDTHQSLQHLDVVKARGGQHGTVELINNYLFNYYQFDSEQQAITDGYTS